MLQLKPENLSKIIEFIKGKEYFNLTITPTDVCMYLIGGCWAKPGSYITCIDGKHIIPGVAWKLEYANIDKIMECGARCIQIEADKTISVKIGTTWYQDGYILPGGMYGDSFKYSS